MIVREFMTSPVIAVASDSSIAEAARLMLDHKISGLPVVDGARHLVGIVSEHDLLRSGEGERSERRLHWLQLMIKREGLVDESARFQSRKVTDVMTPSPITVAPTSALWEACRLIKQHGIKRLPVVQDGELVGIIARADLVRALAQTTDHAFSTPNNSVGEHIRELELQTLRQAARMPKPF
jgi:CBS domain-containing protein